MAICCSVPSRNDYSSPGRTKRAAVSTPDNHSRFWAKRCVPVFANSNGDILVGHGLDGVSGCWSNQSPAGPSSDDPDSMKSATDKLCKNFGIRKSMVSLVARADEKPPFGGSGETVRWCLYRCRDPEANHNPQAMFTSSAGAALKTGTEAGGVSWMPVKNLLSKAPENKSPVYRAFKRWLSRHVLEWNCAVGSIDLSGRWEKDTARSVGVCKALLARGHTEEAAATAEKNSSVQDWVSAGTDGEWEVTAYDADGITPRRVLTYSLGEWEEFYGYGSALFGPYPGVVRRRTMWLPEPAADQLRSLFIGGKGENDRGLVAATSLAHVTVTATELGLEESRRYLKDGNLVLRRTFMAHGQPVDAAPVVSEEVFLRRGSMSHLVSGTVPQNKLAATRLPEEEACLLQGRCPCLLSELKRHPRALKHREAKVEPENLNRQVHSPRKVN